MSKLLLDANRIQKYFGDRLVLDVEHLQIHDGERIALIGENGAGKTTLLSILSGETAPDSGSVRCLGPVAVIRQSGEARGNGSARLVSEFRAPGQHDGLSGGEMTRRRIAEALTENASLLLADEPTTDLDAAGIDRLTRFLKEYPGALLLVSHDRDLLNALCTRVLHLEDGRISDFPGSYSDYQAELQRRREYQQFEYDQYRAEQARLKALAQQKAEWAASVKKAPKRMGNSEARLHTREYTNAVLRQSAARKIVERRMERLEKKERPRDLPEIRMTMGVDHPVPAKTVLRVRCDALEAGNRVLLSDAEFGLPTGSRTALMGNNGCGKTTLLRTLRGEPTAGTVFKGELRIHPEARIGSFDQDHAKTLDMDAAALDNVLFSSRFPESEARTVLARLNLRGDHVFKQVRLLSGGERAKVAIAKLLLSDVNLLILDEPTNHLDLFTMEALEALLQGYGGTILFVSHDRAFVSAIADRILTIENGALTAFEGSLKQKEASARRSANAENRQMEITTLEMRLAALAARMSAPKKGDRPDQLNEEYLSVSARLKALKDPPAR